MKGVILAGGKGTRLLPVTRVVNKHMVPILNRPMITYPLQTLIAIGIRDIMIVSGGDHIGGIAEFLGDGESFGVSLTYRVQREAGGIAQALGLAKDFARGEAVAVILGDNIFDNGRIQEIMRQYAEEGISGAHLFLKKVPDPHRFGVLVMDTNGEFRIVEKPTEEVGNDAVTGLYIYPPDVFDVIPTLTPSARGELEITDVNNAMIDRKVCVGHNIGDAFWSDAGTPESLYEVTKWAYEHR